MIEAYKNFGRAVIDFTGRSSRSDYWFAVLANILVLGLLGYNIHIYRCQWW